MPYLKLVALATGRSIEAREPVVRLGRDPGSTIVFSGDEANVVSARHAEVRHTSGGWHLVDLGSRNGTLVNGARVTGAVPLKVGDKISLGDSGPKLTVAAVTEEVAPTVAEHPAIEMRAYAVSLRGTDFASMAQRDQGAVGLITVSLGRQYYSGSGFVISPDGYMLTNWHVVADSNNARADTIWVTMADHADARFADVIAASQPRDIALLKIRGYQGPYVTGIDWGGARARQGEPAALIGYPAGAGFARAGSRSAAVRTSMTAGIISRVTDDLIQFDGMTIGGSSGSPLFNADGEVISIHRAGLPQAPGFALSVPVKQAIPLLPDPLKQQLMHSP